MKPTVHVMVGVLRDHLGRVLINQRPSGKVQAGRWEFPGGKLESCESPEAGLRRELHEELGIVAGPMRRFIEIRHDYPGFSVRLDVREVLSFGGEPRARESQALKWVTPDALPFEDILEADGAIVQALRLPDRVLVTPDPREMSESCFLSCLETALNDGVRFVRFRARSLSQSEYSQLAGKLLPLCRRTDTALVLDAGPDMSMPSEADGVHVDSRQLRMLHTRPVSRDKWFSASCHTASDILQAHRVLADFILLGPVDATATHPGARPIGWSGFHALMQTCSVPAFALGGMEVTYIDQARNCGARGIAAIRGLWPKD